MGFPLGYRASARPHVIELTSLHAHVHHLEDSLDQFSKSLDTACAHDLPRNTLPPALAFPRPADNLVVNHHHSNDASSSFAPGTLIGSLEKATNPNELYIQPPSSHEDDMDFLLDVNDPSSSTTSLSSSSLPHPVTSSLSSSVGADTRVPPVSCNVSQSPPVGLLLPAPPPLPAQTILPFFDSATWLHDSMDTSRDLSYPIGQSASPSRSTDTHDSKSNVSARALFPLDTNNLPLSIFEDENDPDSLQSFLSMSF